MAIKLQLRIGYSGSNDSANRQNPSCLDSYQYIYCCTHSQNYMGNTSFSRPTTRRLGQEWNEAPTTDLLHIMSTQACHFPPLIIVINEMFSYIMPFCPFPTQLTSNFTVVQRCGRVNANLLTGLVQYRSSVIWYIFTSVSFNIGTTSTPFR